jgi:hypothetical protein
MQNRAFAAAIFALLVVAAPTRAATITWDLNATAEPGQFPQWQGEQLTGVIDWNTTTSTPIDWTISGVGPTVFTNNCTSATCYWALFGDGVLGGNEPVNFDFITPNSKGAVLDYGITALNGPASLLYIHGYVGSGVLGTFSGTLSAQPSAVPLPAGLPLFGTALAGLGAVGWFKKRRGFSA